MTTKLIYQPVNDDSKPEKATFGVKFCQDTYLSKAFMDLRGIEYKEEELEDGPYGRVLRIKRKEK